MKLGYAKTYFGRCDMASEGTMARAHTIRRESYAGGPIFRGQPLDARREKAVKMMRRQRAVKNLVVACSIYSGLTVIIIGGSP
jgi:hypothetical protein